MKIRLEPVFLNLYFKHLFKSQQSDKRGIKSYTPLFHLGKLLSGKSLNKENT